MGFAIGDVAHGDVEAAAKVLLPPTRPQTDVSQLLNQGGVVVVVGGKPGNFSHDQLHNPRVVFWHGTDPKTSSPDRRFPANARAVLFSGVIGHDREHALRRQAKDRGMFAAPGLLTTGDIREVLDKILTRPERRVPDPEPLPVVGPEQLTPPTTVAWTSALPKEEEQVMPRVKLRSPRRGELKTFVLAHANPTDRSIEQAKRLMPELEQAGLQSTLISVDQAIRFYVTAPARLHAAKAARKAERLAKVVAPMTVLPKAPPMWQPTPGESSVMELIATALQMAEDAKASAELMIENLKAIQHDVRRLQAAKQHAKQALEEYLK